MQADNTSITLAIDVDNPAAAGYAGFGLSEAGSMKVRAGFSFFLFFSFLFFYFSLRAGRTLGLSEGGGEHDEGACGTRAGFQMIILYLYYYIIRSAELTHS